MSVAKITGTGERIATYVVPDHQMAVGSTLGGPKCALIVKATGAIEKIYSIEAGETMIGTIVFHHWDDQAGIPLAPSPGVFHIHPDRQDHHFMLANGVSVRQRIFVLNTRCPGNKVDPPAAYKVIQLENTTDSDVAMATYAFIELRGSLTPDDLRVRYDKRRNAFLVLNDKRPDFARMVGSSLEPTSCQVSSDHGMATANASPAELNGKLDARGSDPLGVFHWHHHLKPGEKREYYLKVVMSVNGDRHVRRQFDESPTAALGLKSTRAHFNEILSRAVLITPDSEVNRGVLWAKANMLRVQLQAQTGACFVNDPTRSNNSVARDTAWFAFGSDYITPEFSRDSLLWYVDNLEKNGMVVEYYDVRTGKTGDYNLNINDDTPLLILALWHHYNTTGNRQFLESIYAKAKRAARYILSQRDDRGLVWCTATLSSDWGIVGWRNVIEGYRLSGATTELNSECYAAFETISHMARVLERHDDSREFRDHAANLKAAINEHLFDRKSGLYYLNIDVDGTVRTDVTGDLVFPVMFGVADDDVAAHIISRLSVEEFWTEGGIRTVPRTAPMYGPTHGFGLLGGVWVNVTFWYAMAAARFNPEFMAYALSTSFKYYSQDPRRNNTVPGQFSEWLHGETLVNQGMMLSPWFPPHYLWAAIEGAAGLNLAGDRPSVTPRLAPDWKWLGVRNLLLRGKNLTWFIARTPDMEMYGNFQFDQSSPSKVYTEDCTDDIEIGGESAAPLALARGRDFVIFIGNTSDRTITTSVRVMRDIHGIYKGRTYNSLRNAWVEKDFEADHLRSGIPIHLDRRGFCLLELRQTV
ncbi:MAG: hypothetical protein M3Y18_04560 [Candidatus Eremiobacteraeota bacterium]|nr:hypothetical protein [Candidatus Eremiobacteraeota bacterium]